MDYRKDMKMTYFLEKEEVTKAILFWLKNRERKVGEEV